MGAESAALRNDLFALSEDQAAEPAPSIEAADVVSGSSNDIPANVRAFLDDQTDWGREARYLRASQPKASLKPSTEGAVFPRLKRFVANFTRSKSRARRRLASGDRDALMRRATLLP